MSLNLSTKKTRKREFLEEMEGVVPWAALAQIVAPYHPKANTSRPPFGIEMMLRIHLQQWFGLSNPAMVSRPCGTRPILSRALSNVGP